MEKLMVKNIVIRCVSVLLAVFSVLFGVTWSKNGYCLGDNILSGLGLKAWSNGTHGTHYAAVCALVLLLAAFFLFAAATKKKDSVFRYLIIGSAAAVICARVVLAVI